MFEGLVAQYGKEVFFLAVFVIVLVEVSRMIPWIGKKIEGKTTRWVSAGTGVLLSFLNNLTASNKDGFIVVIGMGLMAAWVASGGTDWLRKIFK